jgi:hypothetical protein
LKNYSKIKRNRPGEINMPGVKKTIDVAGIKTKDELLTLLGRELFLGGVNGNHPLKAVNAGAGWGMNWDALKDSLSCLDSGGIWGTSPKLEFPLLLEFINSDQYMNADREGFRILKSILNDTKATYLKDGLQFNYAFTSNKTE